MQASSAGASQVTNNFVTGPNGIASWGRRDPTEAVSLDDAQRRLQGKQQLHAGSVAYLHAMCNVKVMLLHLARH